MAMSLKAMKDKLESYFRSKGFTVDKAKQVVEECLERIEQLSVSSGQLPNETLIRTAIEDVLTKSTTQSPQPSASAATAAPGHSLVDDAVALLKHAL